MCLQDEEEEEEVGYDHNNEDVPDAIGVPEAMEAGNLPLLGMVPGFLEHAAGMQPLWRMRRPSDSNDALVEQLTREGTITMWVASCPPALPACLYNHS